MKRVNLHYDSIIYKLQKFGGVSTFWRNLTSRVIEKQRFDITLTSGNQLTRFLPVITSSDVFHSSYFRLPTNFDTKVVVTAHDFLYQLGYLRSKFAYLGELQHYLSFKRANAIVCISESTKRDLLNVYPDLSKKSIEVIYHGIDSTFDYKLKDDVEYSFPFNKYQYLLFVGDRFGYKNWMLAVESFKISNLFTKGFKLICTGKPFSRRELKYLDQQGVLDKVLCCPSVNILGLRSLYKYAFALLYLSCYEGFGLPPLEAMSLGCPVIALNRSSIPEVVGEAGLLVESSSSNEVSACINQLMDSSLHADLCQASRERSTMFSWNIAASKYSDLYYSMI
jgi:glycosyltransferase involved in cell wall biosynthesis